MLVILDKSSIQPFKKASPATVTNLQIPDNSVKVAISMTSIPPSQNKASTVVDQMDSIRVASNLAKIVLKARIIADRHVTRCS